MPPKKRKAAEAAMSDPSEGTRVLKSQRVNARPVEVTAALDRPRRDPKGLEISRLNSNSKNSATKVTKVPTDTGTSKKRGRPRKSAARSPAKEASNAFGRPSKTAFPKATPAPKTKASLDGGVRKRGRPPKGTTTSTAPKLAKIPKTGMRSSLRLQAFSSTSSTPISKVAFAKTTTTIPATPTGSGNGRGRPPKRSILKNKDTADNDTTAKGDASKTNINKSGTVFKGKKAATKAKTEVQPEVEANGDEENRDGSGTGKSFWLMKAEPESRLEKNVDVKFSIDDLEAATEPQGWDGVRNLAARNNLRAMKKGDLAFFYHSNCKVPGIVGIMEIVEEHSVDESAFDENHPYHDLKSDRENPKWSLVHVEFRRKFPHMITLHDLKSYAKPGGALENLQTLKQSRLSVSKVSAEEWYFIMSLQEELSSPEATMKSPLPPHVPNGEPQAQLKHELEDQIAEQEQEQGAAQDGGHQDEVPDEEEDDDPTLESAADGDISE